MNLYVWKNVEKVSGNYHDEGGIMVIADTLDAARELIKASAPEGCGAVTEEPDPVRKCDGPETVLVFPDAGCC